MQITPQQAHEIYELIEDTVQYYCDEHMLSGELVYAVVECVALTKQAELQGLLAAWLMIIKNPVNYVSDGIMTFIDALTREHHLDEAAVLTRVRKLCKERLNSLEASDPLRNR